jgi:hypothetical protein
MARHRNAILAAMLLLVHGAVWWDFGDLQSRSLMLVHLGAMAAPLEPGAPAAYGAPWVRSCSSYS